MAVRSISSEDSSPLVLALLLGNVSDDDTVMRFKHDGSQVEVLVPRPLWRSRLAASPLIVAELSVHPSVQQGQPP
jgi:hypothetical protein